VSDISPFALPAGAAQAPLDPALLAQMASAMFGTLGAASAPGVQAPGNVAPAGSPLASAAGFGPGVPGTPIPQGQVPGSNLMPGSSSQVLSLGNRAPSMMPSALAGNGVPDKVLSAVPAYEPRLGGQVLGVPQATLPSPLSTQGAAATPYYFLEQSSAAAPVPDPLDALVAPAMPAPQPAALPQVPPTTSGTVGWAGLPPTRSSNAGFEVAPGHKLAERVGGQAAHPTKTSPTLFGDSAFYFVDAVVLPADHVTAQPGPHGRAPLADASRHQAFDVHAVRRDFPTLQERINGHQLVWFDNAATTHKPQAVIDRIAHFYARENSNIHRAAHDMAGRATDAYEGARESVRRFINAPDVNEVIFVRGTTEAINLVAKSWGMQHIGEGDEIIVSHLEHHANIVPWQQLASCKGARLRVIPVDDSGQVLLDEFGKLLNDRTKLVAVTQVSNALGTVTPVKEIVAMAQRAGARVLVDGAQSVSHMRTDVQALGADFLVFSGHKVFGPTGIGVLWGKREVLENMPPWQGGGNMIADVTFEKTLFQPIPHKFEAGTGNIADAAGLGAALDYVGRIGIDTIARYEHDLLAYGMRELACIKGVRMIGTALEKASVMSFVLDGYSTGEVGAALNEEGIAVRTGHHCAQPILRRFGVESTVRPSLAFYNTYDEIDHLVKVVRRLA
jgi:cysteine desulfurase/selenocysteine lyase